MKLRSIALGSAVCATLLLVLRSFTTPPSPTTEKFEKTWNNGKAEITTYELHQARYGELHSGTATVIFIPELHDSRRQVKIDSPDDTVGKHAVSMMHCNIMKNFNTGVNAHSLMTSVFTPLDSGARYSKLTSVAEDWQGHSYTQINRKQSLMHFRSFSFYEEEGDIDTAYYNTQLLEDDVWNTIRLQPSLLPLGERLMFPSIMFCRIVHVPIQAYRVEASLKTEKKLQAYTLHYPQLQRTITIWFNAAYPHEIEKWEETYRDGFGDHSKVLTTSATRKKRIWSDYWNKQKTTDVKMREQLGLK